MGWWLKVDPCPQVFHGARICGSMLKGKCFGFGVLEGSWIRPRTPKPLSELAKPITRQDCVLCLTQHAQVNCSKLHPKPWAASSVPLKPRNRKYYRPFTHGLDDKRPRPPSRNIAEAEEGRPPEVTWASSSCCISTSTRGTEC